MPKFTPEGLPFVELEIIARYAQEYDSSEELIAEVEGYLKRNDEHLFGYLQLEKANDYTLYSYDLVLYKLMSMQAFASGMGRLAAITEETIDETLDEAKATPNYGLRMFLNLVDHNRNLYDAMARDLAPRSEPEREFLATKMGVFYGLLGNQAKKSQNKC